MFSRVFQKCLSKIQRLSWFEKIVVLLFILAVVLLIRYQFYMLNFREWGDESETIVKAKMMADGSLLYNDIFSHHGTIFLLPGLILESIGNFGISTHRITILLLQWIALLSLYFSPILRSGVSKRFAFIIIGTVMVVFLPDILGYMYLYQTIGGLFSFIVLCQYTLPAVLLIRQKKWIIIVCAMLTASLPFISVTYLPAVLLILLTTVRKSNIMESIIGIISGIALNLLFIISFSSISGFWVYHIYFNSQLYAASTQTSTMINNIIDVTLNNMLGFLTAIYLFMIAGILHIHSKERYFWRGIAVILIVASYFIRGPIWCFHGLPYWYSLLAVSSVFFIRIKSPLKVRSADETATILRNSPVLFLVLICIFKLSLFFPGELKMISLQQIPKETDFSRLVKTITTRDDRILALSFQNFEYIASDRLPASAHFFYLPWQALYSKNPKMGLINNLKDDILKNRPKIIMADKWTVFDKKEFAWLNYAADIEEVLESEYYQIRNKPYYIRNDINLEDYDFGFLSDLPYYYFAYNDYFPVDERSNIGEITEGKTYYQLIPYIKADTINGISLIFSTYSRKNNGKIRATLKTPDNRYIHQEYVNISIVTHDSFYDFYFDEPWTGMKGEKVEIILDETDSIPGNAITLVLGNNRRGDEYNTRINGEMIEGKAFSCRILLEDYMVKRRLR